MPDQDTAQLASQIELYLLERGGWVPSREICERFGVRERLLRRDGRRKGLLVRFAMSSTNNGEHGFIHHRFLGIREYLRIKHGRLRHAIAEIRTVQDAEFGRRNCLTGPPQALFEAHTGQGLLPMRLTP